MQRTSNDKACAHDTHSYSFLGYVTCADGLPRAECCGA